MTTCGSSAELFGILGEHFLGKHVSLAPGARPGRVVVMDSRIQTDLHGCCLFKVVADEVDKIPWRELGLPEPSPIEVMSFKVKYNL